MNFECQLPFPAVAQQKVRQIPAVGYQDDQDDVELLNRPCRHLAFHLLKKDMKGKS